MMLLLLLFESPLHFHPARCIVSLLTPPGLPPIGFCDCDCILHPPLPPTLQPDI